MDLDFSHIRGGLEGEFFLALYLFFIPEDKPLVFP
jgi:hypothetical protein